jgi:hydrogenase small subunit
VVAIPGCPVHPDWIVGTIAYILANKALPPLDANNRPTMFFGQMLHDICPRRATFNSTYGTRHNQGTSCLTCHSNTDSGVYSPRQLGTLGCMYALGCKGPKTHCDCPSRKWNGPGANQPGVSWCNLAGAPCIGCTEPTFPDGMSPFYTLSGPGVDD